MSIQAVSIKQSFSHSVLSGQSEVVGGDNLSKVFGEAVVVNELTGLHAGMRARLSSKQTLGDLNKAMKATAKSIEVSESLFMRAIKGFGTVVYMFYEYTPVGCIARQIKWQKAFVNTATEQRSAISELMGQLMLTEEDREKAVQTVAKMVSSEEMELKQSEFDRLTDEEFIFIESKTREILEGMGVKENEELSDHIKIGLAKELSRLMGEKETTLLNNTGFSTMYFAKRELHKSVEEQLVHRLENAEENDDSLQEADSVIEKALEENKRSVAINAICAVASTLGFVGIAFAFILPPALPLYLILAGIILSNLVIFGVDIYKLMEEVKETNVVPKNAINMLILSALFIAFTGVGPYLNVQLAIKLSVILVGAIFATARIGIALFAPKE